MVCEIAKIDSNITGLAFAEEECLKKLSDFTPAVAATGTLTIGGVPTEGDEIVIGSKTYVMRENAFDAETNEILFDGTTAAQLAQRIANAINLGSTGETSTYVGDGTTASTQVSASVAGS